ncbi:hypothetical protein [Burkholderia diffusa]|uniref:hypothetical protein n=1 Tax=Burkholderia diffusa TaxID=488732 RepID=UPI002AB30F84|nr:hypothetical protein [Burkholderia diffusa]
MFGTLMVTRAGERHRHAAGSLIGNPQTRVGRRTITPPILNSKGPRLLAIYDYDGKRTSKCEWVTLTYPVE